MFGEKLKELRKQNNLTQLDIANMFGVTYSAVSTWEVGKAQPDYDILKKLAEYFHVSTDYLLDFNQEDVEKIEKLRTALIEAGWMKNTDEDIDKEHFEKAMQIMEMLKEDK